MERRRRLEGPRVPGYRETLRDRSSSQEERKRKMRCQRDIRSSYESQPGRWNLNRPRIQKEAERNMTVTLLLGAPSVTGPPARHHQPVPLSHRPGPHLRMLLPRTSRSPTTPILLISRNHTSTTGLPARYQPRPGHRLPCPSQARFTKSPRSPQHNPAQTRRPSPR